MSMHKLILFLLLLLIAAFLFLFRRNILNGTISARQQLTFWALAAGVALLYFPYMTDYILLGEETAFHLIRISELAGTPKGYLSVPAMLLQAGFSLMTAYKLFVLLSIVTAAAMTFFALNRCIKDTDITLLLSLLYLVNPFYLNCLYPVGSAGQYTAYIFLPMIITSLYLLRPDNRDADTHYSSHTWYLLWGLAGVWLSHTPTAIAATLCTAVAGICYACPPLRKLLTVLTARLRERSQKLKLFLTGLAAISVLFTVFQSNRLVFETMPYYISSADELTVQSAGALSPVTDILALISLIALILHSVSDFPCRKKATRAERSK